MHQASRKRYETMEYHFCGKSGLKLPAVSLVFGITLETMRTMII